MQYYERTVKFFKFFEDIKIMELDNKDNKIAIIFNGKENFIHIFDSSPYLNYVPYKVQKNNESIEEINLNNNNLPFKNFSSNFNEYDNQYLEKRKEDLLEIFNDINRLGKF